MPEPSTQTPTRADHADRYAFVYWLTSGHKQAAQLLSELADHKRDFPEFVRAVISVQETYESRHAPRRPESFKEDLEMIARLGDEPEAAEISVSNKMKWETSRLCFAQAMQSLTLKVRVTVILSDVMGRSLDEISEILGIRRESMQMRKTRGRRELSRILEPRCRYFSSTICSCESRARGLVRLSQFEIEPDVSNVEFAPRNAHDIIEVARQLPMPRNMEVTRNDS